MGMTEDEACECVVRHFPGAVVETVDVSDWEPSRPFGRDSASVGRFPPRTRPDSRDVSDFVVTSGPESAAAKVPSDRLTSTYGPIAREIASRTPGGEGR